METVKYLSELTEPSGPVVSYLHEALNLNAIFAEHLRFKRELLTQIHNDNHKGHTGLVNVHPPQRKREGTNKGRSIYAK